jgi:hypothetical protein
MKKTLLTLSLLTAIFGASKAQNFQSYEKTIPNTTVKFKMVAIPAGELSLGSLKVNWDMSQMNHHK